MAALATQTYSAVGNFSLNLSPGDTTFFLGVWPTAGAAYNGVQLKVEGFRGGQPYLLAPYTTQDTGPLVNPIVVPDGVNIAYTFRVEIYASVKVTVVTIGGGTINLDPLSGNFFGNPPPQKVFGVGGSIGVTAPGGGPVVVAGALAGAVQTQDSQPVQRTNDDRLTRAIERLTSQMILFRRDQVLLWDAGGARNVDQMMPSPEELASADIGSN